ncbi:hypothetical protein K9N68_06820 [Kovacikia minuta CCNUW1]|uniref:hypothetical protein n=1 Tax=Kovacikia minuta TaxID=2931930 RepID=UPI001CCFD64B|nr:hypothetical protein [Kovacikia minuta]UBF27627.1 hypothetical protein K9N68_06820 [Kovacikia minuta CCNUW1]
MSLKNRYPDFTNFLSSWLADPSDDMLSDDRLAVNYIQYGIPLPAYDRLLSQGKSLLQEKPFPWQEIAAHANRVFKNETYAYHWLEKIIDVFENNHPKK